MFACGAHFRSVHLRSGAYREVVDVLNARGYDTPPDDLLSDLQRHCGHSDSTLRAALHLALWRQDVDHDLSEPFKPWQPLSRGGNALKAALFDAWVGGEAGAIQGSRVRRDEHSQGLRRCRGEAPKELRLL